MFPRIPSKNCDRPPRMPSHVGRRPPVDAGEPLCRLISAAVASGFGVSRELLDSVGRKAAPVARARQVAVYLARVGFGLELARVRAAFGRDPATIRHACARIEEARDDGAFDRALGALETGIRALARATGLETARPSRASGRA